MTPKEIYANDNLRELIFILSYKSDELEKEPWQESDHARIIECAKIIKDYKEKLKAFKEWKKTAEVDVEITKEYMFFNPFIDF